MNVLWWIADALRWDTAKKKMRFLRHWSEDACILDQHFSMAHCSDPNFLSLLTGHPPWGEQGHGVYKQLDVTRGGKVVQYPRYLGLQIELRKRHHHRSLMMGPVHPTIYQWGFDVLVPIGRKDKTYPGHEGLKLFMDESAEMGRPWFAFVRTMDCHAPYYGGHYHRAVKFTDSLIADLFPWVEKHHPNTQIWLFSDHGESLGEHGMRGHFSTLYDVLLHTPMYVKFPGGKAQTVNEFSRHIDVPATVCGLIDGEPFGTGRDWSSVLRGELQPRAEPSGLMYFAGNGAWRESYWDWRAVRDARFKCLVSMHVKEGAKFHLYDIQGDPREQMNLAERDEWRPTLKKYARLLYKQFPDVVPELDDADEWASPYTDEEAAILVDRLRRLGYA